MGEGVWSSLGARHGGVGTDPYRLFWKSLEPPLTPTNLATLISRNLLSSFTCTHKNMCIHGLCFMYSCHNSFSLLRLAPTCNASACDGSKPDCSLETDARANAGGAEGEGTRWTRAVSPLLAPGVCSRDGLASQTSQTTAQTKRFLWCAFICVLCTTVMGNCPSWEVDPPAPPPAQQEDPVRIHYELWDTPRLVIL